jgi:hypothetical protein
MTILGQEAITLRRRAAGTRGTDGRWDAGASTDSTIRASVQPASGDDLAILPEGLRMKRGKRVYTKTELRVGSLDDGTDADRLVIDSTVYQVQHVERVRSVIAHYKAIALAEQEAPT